MIKVSPIFHQSEKDLYQEQIWISQAKKNLTDFTPLYKKYHQQIFYYINSKMNDEQWAYDITSQVFLKALKNLERFTFKGIPMSSWLYRIAKSEVNQAYRNNKKRKVTSLEKLPVAAISMDIYEWDKDSFIDKSALKLALSQLSRAEKRLIEMHYFQGIKYKDIAITLDISENNAKVRAHRAIKRLRTYFEEINNEEKRKAS